MSAVGGYSTMRMKSAHAAPHFTGSLPSFEVLEADCLERLRALPPNSVHCCVTSPPYWLLRDYDVSPSVWGGDPACAHDWRWGAHQRKGSTNGREGSTLRNAGSARLTGAGPDSPDGHRIDESAVCARCGAWLGCLGLEPALDCGRSWIDARGPALRGDLTGEEREGALAALRDAGLLDKLAPAGRCGQCYVCHIVDVFREVRRVLRADGTLWVVIGDAYNAFSGNRGTRSTFRGDRQLVGEPILPPGHGLSVKVLKPKDLLAVPWAVGIALRNDGWWLRMDNIWHKTNAMAESATDRPMKAHEYVLLLSKSARYYYDREAVRGPLAPKTLTAHGTRRRRRGGDALGKVKADNLAHTIPERRPALAPDGSVAGANKRSVWPVATRPSPDERHFASYPPQLVEPCVLAGTSARGVCPECGAPWRRLLGEPVSTGEASSGNKARVLATGPGDPRLNDHVGRSFPWESAYTPTLGWEPGCGCGLDPVPATVLDPFSGTGATGRAALRHERSYLGIELSGSSARRSRELLRGDHPLLHPASGGEGRG